MKPGLDLLERGLIPDRIEGPVHPERNQVEIVEALSAGEPLQRGRFVPPLRLDSRNVKFSVPDDCLEFLHFTLGVGLGSELMIDEGQAEVAVIIVERRRGRLTGNPRLLNLPGCNKCVLHKRRKGV
jgi:hypothetical protein